MQKTGFVLVALLSTQAFASPARPTGGPINVQVAVSPNLVQAFNAGSIELNQSLPMTVSFFYPKQASGGIQKATFIFDPLDSTVSTTQLTPVQNKPEDSSFDDPSIYELNLANTPSGTTVSVPFNWTPNGKYGASARVTVILTTPAGRSSGSAALTVGTVNNKNIIPMSSTQIYKNQLSKMKQNIVQTAAELVAQPSDTTPFIPANHVDALKNVSPEFKLEN